MKQIVIFQFENKNFTAGREVKKKKKIEIIPSIFSDHNAIRLDLNYRRKTI